MRKHRPAGSRRKVFAVVFLNGRRRAVRINAPRLFKPTRVTEITHSQRHDGNHHDSSPVMIYSLNSVVIFFDTFFRKFRCQALILRRTKNYTLSHRSYSSEVFPMAFRSPSFEAVQEVYRQRRFGTCSRKIISSVCAATVEEMIDQAKAIEASGRHHRVARRLFC